MCMCGRGYKEKKRKEKNKYKFLESKVRKVINFSIQDTAVNM